MPRPSAIPPAAMTGDTDRIDDLRNERHGSRLRVDAVGQKRAAVTACLVPLRNHRITAAFFQPAGLFDGRRGAEHLAAKRLHPSQQPRCREPEVKAHDLRLDLLDHVAHRVVERRSPGRRTGRRDIERVLGVSTARNGPSTPARVQRREVADGGRRN